MKQTFSLQPFPSRETLPNLKIAGNITRDANRLAIYYQLAGDLTEIAIADPSNLPTRQHELWEDTCFEFFLGSKNCDRYWEFNLSPAGHWNVYRFEDYRQGMQEEMALTALPFSVEERSHRLELSLHLDLSPIVPADCILEVAITTVIKSRNGDLTYWALVHQGAEADFHLRDSFALTLT